MGFIPRLKQVEAAGVEACLHLGDLSRPADILRMFDEVRCSLVTALG